MSIPIGLCQCGCGRAVAKRFVNGHNRPTLRHGQSSRNGKPVKRTPEYAAYVAARQRCTNSKVEKFAHYGGRGIRFLFESFEDFFAELGPRPSKRHSLDRKFNDGHYEAGNVRWATKRQQVRNQRPRTAHLRLAARKKALNPPTLAFATPTSTTQGL
jgi:hypothetical protein